MTASGRHMRRTRLRNRRQRRAEDFYAIGRIMRRYCDQGGDERPSAWPRPPLTVREWLALRAGYRRGDR